MHLIDQPHHDGSALHVSNPDPSLGETVSVFLRVPDAAAADGVHVRTVIDGEPDFVEAVVDRRADGETWCLVAARFLQGPATRGGDRHLRPRHDP